MWLGEDLNWFYWWPISFLNLDIQIFPQIWEVLSHSFFKEDFFPLFLCSSGTPIIHKLVLLMVSHICFLHCFSFFSLFPWLDTSKFLFSTSPIISSAWSMSLLLLFFPAFCHFIHWPVQLQNFCLVLLYDFYLYVKLLLFMYCFPDFVKLYFCFLL